MTDKKPKPEVLKVLDEFARTTGYKDWGQLEHVTERPEDAIDDLKDLATLAYEQGRKEKMRPDSITMDIKEFDELVVSNDARKDIIERQKERIAQLERDAIQQKVNYRKALENAKEQGKLDQSLLAKSLGKNDGYGTGALFLTAMGRIVRDDHNYEAFRPPYDVCIMTAKELTQGISLEEFKRRLKSQLSKSEKKEVD